MQRSNAKKSPKFCKKHYTVLANYLAGARYAHNILNEKQHQTMVNYLCNILYNDNPQFIDELFRKAANEFKL